MSYEERYPGAARREHLDPTPLALPVGFRSPPSLIDQMRSMIRREFSEAAAMAGRETFEEANDFDVPDDPDDPQTPWEVAADGDQEVAQGLEDARHSRAARQAGWKPSPEDQAWESWAKRNGWTPPSKPELTSPASAAGGTGGNPNPANEASRHSPNT